VRVPSVPMPGYPTFRIGLPSTKIIQGLSVFAPDVVHLASPFVLGAYGMAAAQQLGLPTIAVYQTDVPRFAAGYGLGLFRAAAWRWVRRIHNLAGRTLAPSTSAARDLAEHGIERVHLWRRGVDAERFHPRHRDEGLRAQFVGDGELLAGYVGRLAPEKHLQLLEPIAHRSTIRLVIVGDGPERQVLERLLPGAVFLGELSGHDLARVYASLDVFIHTGPYETFCQTVQEALASGVPVVAPNRGGPRDLVQPGVNGILVRPDDAAEFAAVVDLLVAGAPYRARLARGARPSVAGRSWAAIGEELVGHYIEVIGSHTRESSLEPATEGWAA
jgi:phosphatidylinositol alpha 1,6-mannosyltransferase